MKVARWRRRAWAWPLAASVIALLVLAPVASLFVEAMRGDTAHWAHLVRHVLPGATADTLLLLSGVGVIVIVLGTGSAWLVTAWEFPGRRLLEWALLLPLAVPTYIVAFAYVDLLHPLGPVQGALRGVLGIVNPRDLWFPEVRSLPAAIVLLGFVLYPYVYLGVRALFIMQSATLLDAARTLGCSRAAMFTRVALPLARPAIAVGTALALMEALNDIGASEFLGVRTLTVSIYSTWVNRSDLAGAAQIALAMLAVVIALLWLERHGRRDQRFAVSAQRSRRMAPMALSGARAWLAVAAGCVPVGIGFVLPAVHLGVQAVERLRFAGFPVGLVDSTLTTLALAASATVITLLAGLVVSWSVRIDSGRTSRLAQRAAAFGYAIPGTVVAIGVLAPVAALDAWLGDSLDAVFGVATGLVLLGSGAALVYAYAVRFLAVSVGGIESGLSRIAPSVDHAARTLGRGPGAMLRDVHLPLLRPAFAAAALLVFVDCMKELPATLLLRPLNVETLATRLYGEAARGTYEEGAIAALLIVLAGLLPVILLARIGRAQDAVASPVPPG